MLDVIKDDTQKENLQCFRLPQVNLPKGAVRICLNAGGTPFDDYQCFDFFSVNPKVTECDLRRLPFEDNSVDEILALQPEHIPHPELLTTFKEWFRVLKPNGYFSMNVPEFETSLRVWLDLPEEKRWGIELSVIFGMQNTPCEVHYTGFTAPRMIDLLETAGFVQVRTEIRTQFGHTRLWGFATKPEQSKSPDVEPGHFGSVHPEALKMTRMLYGSMLEKTDYNWIKREAEYDKYKEWAAEYERSRAERDEHIAHLAKTIEIKETMLKEHVEIINRLNSVIEEKQTMLLEHVDLINEKVRSIDELKAEVAKLSSLLGTSKGAV